LRSAFTPGKVFDTLRICRMGAASGMGASGRGLPAVLADVHAVAPYAAAMPHRRFVVG
jgi:hypothetical protein